jgi:hypothetical protein
MRRSLVVALVAMVSLALAAVAVAQYPTPTVTLKGKVTPTKVGTKKKPKNSKIRLTATNSAESRTTATRITFLLPRGVRLNGKGFAFCPATEVQAEGVQGCPSASRVGSGTATALYGPRLTPVNFTVTLFTASAKELTVYLEATGLPIKRAIRGLITPAGSPYGSKITIDLPEDLQQPVRPGPFVYLTGVDVTVGKTRTVKRKRYNLVSTVSCPRDRKHRYEVRIDYGANPSEPVVKQGQAGATSACRS